MERIRESLPAMVRHRGGLTKGANGVGKAASTVLADERWQAEIEQLTDDRARWGARARLSRVEVGADR